MPLAAYSYPYPPHSSAGSGVNNLHPIVHPAPPALADGIYFSPRGPDTCGYPSHYDTPAPPHCCPYANHRLHHNGALPQAMHPLYPHIHYYPGLPCCTLPPDGLPTYSIASPDKVDGRGAHVMRPYGPAFALDSFPNHGSPQLFYPPMSAMPLWRSDECPSRDEDADSEVKGVKDVPSHFLVPSHDKVQGAKPSNMYSGTPQWRGFPVMWKGNAPYAFVPLSNVDGEQNLFVPKKVSAQSAPEDSQKSATAYMDWPLPARSHLPIMCKQQSLTPATTQEDDKEKLNEEGSQNGEDGKVKLIAKDSINDEVRNSKPLPVIWDGKSPLVILPDTHEAGKDFSSFMPFKLTPMTNEVGQEPIKPQPQAIIPVGKERQQDCDKLLIEDALVPHTKDTLVTPLYENEKEPRELEKGKAFMPRNEGPIKVIPVVQLPSIDSVMQKELSVQKEPPNDIGEGKAGIEHTHAKPQTGQQAGKMTSHAQGVAKQEFKGPSKDPLAKRSFPAIKLVPPSDVRRSKSPRKIFDAVQKKPAFEKRQSVEPVQDGCRTGVTIPTKDASLHEKIDSGLHGSDDKGALIVKVDGKAAVEGALPKAVECKPVSSLNVDGKVAEKVVSLHNVEQKHNEVLPFTSMEAIHGSCDRKMFQAPYASELEKPQVKMISLDSAAKCIQAAYRGSCVRRSQPLVQLRILKEIQANMPSLFQQLDSKTELLKEAVERRKLSESMMALLLRLDTVQGRLPFVREQRKSVAKELSRALETLDNIEQEKASISTPGTTNEIAEEQEEGSLSTPNTVSNLAEGQEEMSTHSHENFSAYKAATIGETGCSTKETLEKGNIIVEAVNLATAASNACSLGIREECEGATVSNNESASVSSSSIDFTRKEKVEAGSELVAPQLPPLLQVESMDRNFGVDQEKLPAFHAYGSLKKHIDPCEGMIKQHRQCDPEKMGEEERKEETGLETPLLKVADMEEGVTVLGGEAAFSDADAVTPMCLIFNSGRDEKMGSQDDARADQRRSLPSNSQVREITEIAKMGRDDSDDDMHLADVKQADQLGESGEVEYIEPRLRCHDSEGSVQSQQLDVPIAEESNEEEVSRLSPDEVLTDPSSSAEVLLEVNCVEQLSLPEQIHVDLPNSAEVLLEDSSAKCSEQLPIPQDHSMGDISTGSEVLIDESGLDSLESNKYTSHVGVEEEGEIATAQQILQEKVDVKQEEGDTPALENLLDILQEKCAVNVPHSDEGHVGLTRPEKLVDGQRLEERENHLLSDAAAEVEKGDNRDDILLHSGVKVEQQFLDGLLVVDDIDDGAETKKDVCVGSIESMLLDNTMALDTRSKDDTDAAYILAARPPIKEVDDDDIEELSMLVDKKAHCVHDVVDATSAQMDEVDSSQMKTDKMGVSLEDIGMDGCILHAGIEGNPSLEKDGYVCDNHKKEYPSLEKDGYVCDNHKKECSIQDLVDVTPRKMDIVDSSQMMVEKSGGYLEDVGAESCLQDVEIKANLSSEEDRCECDDDKKLSCIQELIDVTAAKMDEEANSNQMMKHISQFSSEDIAAERDIQDAKSGIQDAWIEENLSREETGPEVPVTAIHKRQDQLSAKFEAENWQKQCFEKLALESKNLLAVVAKLTEWNEQQVSLITQLSERMSRLENVQNASKHSLHSRKGRSRRRRKISVNI